MSKIIGYVGGHKSNTPIGLHQFIFDKTNEKFISLNLLVPYDNPDYFAFDENEKQFLSIIKDNQETGIISFSIHKDNSVTKTQKILTNDQKPCFISLKEEVLCSASYHGGNVNIYQKSNTHFQLFKQIQLGKDAKAHQSFIWKQYLIVVSLGYDQILFYDTTNAYKLAHTIHFPKGSGPRHCIFNSTSSKLYVLSELSNELFVFNRKENLDFVLVEKKSLLLANPSSHTNHSAAIRITKDDKFLYTSTRGEDTISVFSLTNETTLLQHIQSFGKHPRDFILDASEAYMFIVNRDSNNLVCLKRDKATGYLSEKLDEIEIHGAVAVQIQKRNI